MKTRNYDFVNSKTWLVNLFLLLSDLVGFAISFFLITLVRKWVLHVSDSYLFDPQVMRTLFILTGISIFIFMLKGLYPGRGRISVIEFKQVTEAIIIASAIVSAYIFIDSRLYNFSRSVYILGGVFEIVIITIDRILIRKLIVSNFPWWGETVAIIGQCKDIESVTKKLHGCRRLGYRPVVGLSLDNEIPTRERSGLPIIPWSLSEQDRIAHQITTIILAVSTNELRQKYPSIYHSVALQFKKTIFILDNDLYGSMMAQPVDLNGQPAIISHQSLFLPALRFIKWIFEMLSCIILAIPFLFIGLILAVLIRVDSKGPIFYWQERIGKNLRPFKLLKFRTMFVNSDEIMTQMFLNPKIKEEWKNYHKLTKDPRITRIGKWIRKYSLDELPQFINIIRGEMSLIGPRPLLQAEIEEMGDVANIVFKVRPGLTGWWQVNGRNNLPFEERTQLDVYYVFNWSLWLDAYIVIKTFWIVLFDRDGK